MALSDDEQRNWQELAAQLARDRRLTRLAARLGVVAAGGALPRKTVLLYVFGAAAGVVALGLGLVAGSTGLVNAAVAILIGTFVLAGILLIAVGIGGIRRDIGHADPP